ncbi:uncharacterized protein LOC103701781 [Phoenix dactylifera]|uniref:Uncharacterized protein LOC103701781 n=1 Tax=Phoenix dactylifera TaxID=42345 RepID=A0A8B7BNL1_PHODC|nr:uncharacterized protein LOC103701781 [Phoenix dactylifera]
MGRSEMDGRCRRHPEHRQSKGVCPFCLRERLSHISAPSSTATTNASSTSSCFSDSNLSSSVYSPPNQDTKTTWLSLLKGNPGKSKPLRKSRSLAFVMRENSEEDRGKQKEKGRKEKDNNNKRKKKGRFWLRLMIGSDGRKKEMDGSLSHSKTMKEKSSAKWVLF